MGCVAKISRLLIIFTCLAAVYLASPLANAAYQFLALSSATLAEVRQRVTPTLREDLQSAGFQLGDAAFIRIFKEENELEIWLRASDEFKLFKTYDICNYSGALGPKLKEGDRQSPEGFYGVDKAAMNPNSTYHLSFNLGFPNLFDQANQRTGSFLMVHGNCVSIGCYAMTDEGIEEIYLIVEAAQEAGQKMVPVHAFPFRMTQDRLALEQDNKWFAYWQNLKQGFDVFEKDRVPPVVSVSDKKYVFSSGSDL